MINGKKIIVVLPAYNAAATLALSVAEIDRSAVDDIILVDDASADNTTEIAHSLGVKTFLHEANFGYGRNQKTCYREALRLGADIVVMLHPDYQYSPKLVAPMAAMAANGVYDAVIGSRILGAGALKGGMPLYKYAANRFLTLFQNLLLDYKLSEYHTGFRAFTREVLLSLPLENNSDDFAFDNQMLAQAIYFGFRVGEISCPAKYFPEASSINFPRSVVYGLSVLDVSLKFRLNKRGLMKSEIFSKNAKFLDEDYYCELKKSN